MRSDDHLAVLERHEAVAEVGGRHRDVLAEPERVVLVDPGVVARLRRCCRRALEARARIAVERPALGAVIAGRVRAVERALALAAIEAHEAAARRRAPDDAVLVDVAAADAESPASARCRFPTVSSCGSKRRNAGRSAEHADRVPDRAVVRVRHHRVGAGATGDALVLARIGRLRSARRIRRACRCRWCRARMAPSPAPWRRRRSRRTPSC